MQIMVSHVVKNGPWHDLEKIAIERRGQACSVRSTGTGRMDVIEISAIPHDLNEFRKRVAAFRPTGSIRRQLARQDMRKRTGPGKSSEIPAPAQVRIRIDLGRLVKIGISTRGEFGGGACAMAPIAVGLRVDDVAAESYQFPVFSGQIQVHGRYLKADFNF